MKRIAILLFCCVLLSSCTGREVPSEPTAAASEPSYTTVCLTQEDLHAGSLVLVNAVYPYDSTRTQTAVVWEGKTNAYLVKDTALSVTPEVLDALNDWLGSFYAQSGAADINIVSGFRSEEEQRSLYDNALQSRGDAYANRYFMQPGHSEHHTGLAVDLALYDVVSGTSADFSDTGVHKWAVEHACEYGFVRRYPVGKSGITGVDCEPWHYRYVGIPHACYMEQNGLCLEEYIDLLKNYPYPAEHLRVSCGGKDYEIWYCAGLAVTVPTDAPYVLSGNNADGFIVTVTLP